MENMNERTRKMINEIVENPLAKKISTKDRSVFEKLIQNELKYLAETTFSGDMAGLGQILIPVYRRAFPMLIAKDFVGVQPMSQPTGYAFAMRYHFAGNTTGNGSTELKGGSTTHDSTDFTYSFSDVNRNAANSLLLVYNSAARRLTDCPEVGYGAAPIACAATLSGLAYSIFTEGNIAIIRTNSAANMTTIKALAGASGSNITNVYDNEAGFKYIMRTYPGPLSKDIGEGTGNTMDEIGMTIDKIAVEAKTRKLKAKYTLEAAQDLKAIHGKDMSAEMIDILTYEIASAIDRDLITAINSAATASTYNLQASGSGRWQLEYFRAAYTEIIRKANDIARTTLRGPGNFVIAAPDVVTMLEQLPSFSGIAPIKATIDTDRPVNNSVSAVVGDMGGRFKVAMDIFATTNYATVGYKGPSSMDSGIIYCPYLPVMMKDTVDPYSAQPSIIFLERSAIMANIFSTDKYYRQITFSNVFNT